jgi:fructosamine-3-kinase
VSASRSLRQRLGRALGVEAVALEPLGGGCIAPVFRARLADGTVFAVKADTDTLELEAAMLEVLRATRTIPVPALRHVEPGLLVMEYVEAGSGLDAAAQHHAADLLAALHGVTADAFGFERDTVIGPLRQPNPWHASWLEFFRDRRLLAMAHEAHEAGRLPASVLAKAERFAHGLERFIVPGGVPSLIHGDMWAGNVLARGGRIAAFIDPAIYYADAEIELAASTLFGTFSEAFFERYEEHRPLRPGFFEARREIYTLYPLLVHVRLFGGGYVAAVERILDRYA